MESKIKLKYGNLEIEYEGSESFLKEQLPELLKTVSDLFCSQVLTSITTVPEPAESDVVNVIGDEKIGSKIEGTTNTVASKLDVKSGPDLILAAAAQITFVQQKDKFHRKDILENMQSASTYYKKTYSNNLSKYLDTLVKSGQLIEQATDVYALPADMRRKMEATLVK